ncbi:MAG TPA: hypothetical protein VM283_04120, partial [Armatimonadota bacterium]|nr:hypothetical protein [Armatimonadota bacterium]
SPAADRPPPGLRPEPPRVEIAAGTDPVLVTVSLGRGVVHVLADVEMLCNSQIGRNDNMLLAANLVLAGGAPDMVYFDEHHRAASERTLLGPPEEATPEVDPRPVRWMLYGLLAVAALYAAGKAQRFGAPLPPAGEERRSADDYVRALAGIYASAHAGDAALGMLAADLRRRMAAVAGTSPTAPPQRLGERLSRRGLPGAEMARLLADLEVPREPVSDPELVRLAREIAQYERML